jgi:hypothetical protein
MYIAENVASADTLSLLEKIRAACAVHAHGLLPQLFLQIRQRFYLDIFNPLECAVSMDDDNKTRMYLDSVKTTDSGSTWRSSGLCQLWKVHVSGDIALRWQRWSEIFMRVASGREAYTTM